VNKQVTQNKLQQQINNRIQKVVNMLPNDQKCVISDGNNTFDELYKHRNAIFIALCRLISSTQSRSVTSSQNLEELTVWKSLKNAQGTESNDWFIMGIGTRKEDCIGYQIPKVYWNDTRFAKELTFAIDFGDNSSKKITEKLLQLRF
jgi:putative component of toxin-antitoxin plasmid stabilization module